MKTKKIVYIAHPVGGDVEGNLEKLKTIYREITATHSDVVPFMPYMATVLSLNDESAIERKLGFDHNYTLFHSGCIDEVWLYGERISDGMSIEISWAYKLNIPVISKTPETQC